MAMMNPFRSAMKTLDFMSADVAVIAGEWYTLGKFTCPAGVGKAIGYGPGRGQAEAEGRIYADFRDNAVAPGAVINGMIRIEAWDPQDRVERVLFEARTEQLRTSATDRTQQLAFPERIPGISKDWKLALRFKADANVTVSRTNTVLLMDVTEYTDR